MFVHNLATVDDFLSCQHHARSQGDGTEQVALLRLAAFFVVNQVGMDILVQVAPLQQLTLGSQPFVHEQLLVGGNRRVDAVDLDVRGILPRHHTHHVGGVLENLGIFGRSHDARLIETV